MQISDIGKSKQAFVVFPIFLSLVTPTAIFSQSAYSRLQPELEHNKFSVVLTGSLLPKASIKTTEGNYHLQSKLQSSFSVGINYDFKLTSTWSLQTGLGLTLTKRNFFLHIPDSDLRGFLSTEGAPQIEDKEVIPILVLPILVKRRCFSNSKGFWEVGAGINLNYSGFLDDEIITSAIADTNYQLTNIFYGEFSSNNNGKPWITMQLTTSKTIFLRNYNLLSIGLFLELSNTDFITGAYQITVPKKPITKGTYSVTGSSLGLALRYTFTGANKRIVKEHQHRQAF